MQTFMQFPHRTHRSTKSASSSAAGGLITPVAALPAPAGMPEVRRLKPSDATSATDETRSVKKSLRDTPFPAPAGAGFWNVKRVPRGGQTATQSIQRTHSLLT